MYKYFTANYCGIPLIDSLKTAIAMRLFLILLVMGMSVSVYALGQRLTIHKQNVTLNTIINEIKRQSGVNILYDADAVLNTPKITVSANNATIGEILNMCFAGLPLEYKLREGYVVISKSRRPAIQGMDAVQQREITGKVIDDQGIPLPGVTVAVRETNIRTSTDAQGRYTIQIPRDGRILIFTAIGFQTREVAIASDNVVDVMLAATVSDLDEVVVVGFGTQKRESVIGAITTISPGKLQTNQTRGLSNALVGQIAGIVGIQRSGEPGYDASDFWIRGINTFGAGGTTPLVIIDGVQRSLDNISPEEIESFSVLKDATATAVYGVRGANGAVVIKTKRGSLGKPRVTVKSDYGLSAPVKLPSYVDGAKHLEILNAARALSGGTDFFTQEYIDRTRSGYDPDLYPNVNWLETVTEDYAANNRVSADVNGGTERLRYRFIMGSFSETGIISTDPNNRDDTQLKLQRYNVRSNIDMDLTSSTLFSFSIGGHLLNRNAPGTDAPTILDWSMQTPPIVHPAVYSTGEFAQNVNRANPWVQATQTGYKKTYQSSIQSLASIEQNIGALWKPLEGLRARVSFSFDAYNWHDIVRTRQPDKYIANGRDAEGNLQLTLVEKGQEFLNFNKGAGGNRSMYLEIPITYERTLGDIHRISALLLYNQRDYVNADVNTAIMAFPYRNQGVAGRFAYDYDSRYFGEFNFGYNGSENFRKGYRFGFFPSFALGWMASNEEFLRDAGYLDKLKLRGSWGLVGNDQIGGRRFSYITTINSTDTRYYWGWTKQLGYPAVREGDFGIPDLTWETAAKTNLGIELGLFRSFSLQFDVFREKRSNIFMQRKTIPELAGYNNTPYANFGKVDNRGFDASLEYNKSFGKDLALSVLGNITKARNKIVEYDEPLGLIGTNRSQTNWSIHQNYGLIADGLYEENDFVNPAKGILKPEIPRSGFGAVYPGDIKYVDVDGDHIITANDIGPIGRPAIPEIVYGFGFSFRYKKLDIGALFQGMASVDFVISGNEMIPGSGDGSIGNILSNVDDRWTPENPSQDVFYPRLSRTRSENNSQSSTWWLKDGSFVRLKHAEIGYTLIQQKSAVFKNARLFLRGTNLLTFSPFTLWDPELGGTGYRSYPSSRIMTFGFDISL